MIAAARILLCLAAAFALVCLGLAALQVRATVAVLPSVVHREAEATRELATQQINAALQIIQVQISQARLAADRQIGDTRVALVSEVQGTRRDALAAIDQVSARAQIAVGDVRLHMSGHLTMMETILADETAKMNASVAKVAEVGPPLTATLGRLQEVVEIGTDCEASPRCWQNTLYDLNLSSQKSSKAFADLTVQTAGIATDVHKFTTEFTRPRTFREKVWSTIKAVGGLAVLAGK